MTTTAGLDVGALLRQARGRVERSQRDLARRVGVTPSSLSRWETGAALPGLHDLDRVLAACGLQLEARLVRRHADLHGEFERLAALSVEQRLRSGLLVGSLVRAVEVTGRDVVLAGGLAALAHGIPVERYGGTVLLTDSDEVLTTFATPMRPMLFMLEERRETGVPLEARTFRMWPETRWLLSHVVPLDVRVVPTGGTWPATVVLPVEAPPLEDGVEVPSWQVRVQAAETLEPDHLVRADVLAAWRDWAADRAP